MRVVIDNKVAFSVDHQPSAVDAVLIAQFCEQLRKMRKTEKNALLRFGVNIKVEVIPSAK